MMTGTSNLVLLPLSILFLFVAGVLLLTLRFYARLDDDLENPRAATEATLGSSLVAATASTTAIRAAVNHPILLAVACVWLAVTFALILSLTVRLYTLRESYAEYPSLVSRKYAVWLVFSAATCIAAGLGSLAFTPLVIVYLFASVALVWTLLTVRVLE